MINVGKDKGITLVALVITIIVLLILAGVTISMVFGDNGIIGRAQNAAESWDQAQRNEQEGLNSLYDEMTNALNGIGGNGRRKWNSFIRWFMERFKRNKHPRLRR